MRGERRLFLLAGPMGILLATRGETRVCAPSLSNDAFMRQVNAMPTFPP